MGQNRSYGSQNSVNSLQSVFSATNSNGLVNSSNSSPPLLDLSEFPSLTSRGQNDSLPQSNATMPGKQPYGKSRFSKRRGSRNFTRDHNWLWCDFHSWIFKCQKWRFVGGFCVGSIFMTTRNFLYALSCSIEYLVRSYMSLNRIVFIIILIPISML